MITIHLIPQAHLDPIWLWAWTSGLDAAIATCRTACDLLDRHPDATFNLGDAWVLEQIERTDAPTFDRIRAHVRSGRWDLSGGWYIQPDCNFPLGASITRQIELGLDYLESRFGVRPGIGMNVDSFGHAASLPTLLRRSGQDRYVMMRPQEHEMALPARLFNWRDQATGQEVMTFRIASAYCTPHNISIEHVRKSITELPAGVEHTMCFFGVSDHGGGPTEQMIEWCRANAGAIEGARMVFSTPARFFDAVAPHRDKLPVVDTELQFHAIGCYSVEGRLKRLVRRAEHVLSQAERARAIDPAPDDVRPLQEAWRSVLFHQFHDTIGGTCLPSAYRYVEADVGGAIAQAERQAVYALRRLMLARLGDDPLQRIVLFNPSNTPFDGYVECEPWCEFTAWQAHWKLLDSDGNPIPFQRLDGESLADPIDRVLFRVRLAPDEVVGVRIDRAGESVEFAPRVQVQPGMLQSDGGASIRFDDDAIRSLNDQPAPVLHLIDDPSDTWTHRIDRYATGPSITPVWGAAQVIDRGALMASLQQEGTIGDSELHAEWRVYAGEPYVDLRLRIYWRERQKVLKFVWGSTTPARSRLDGTLGGSTERPLDGREYPLQDWVLTRHGSIDRAVVCPDTFGVDASPEHLRLTLLRSPILAHHEPNPGIAARRVYSDRGEHALRFRFVIQPTLDQDWLPHQAIGVHQPPLVADLTRGMPSLRHRGQKR